MNLRVLPYTLTVAMEEIYAANIEAPAPDPDHREKSIKKIP